MDKRDLLIENIEKICHNWIGIYAHSRAAVNRFPVSHQEAQEMERVPRRILSEIGMYKEGFDIYE